MTFLNPKGGYKEIKSSLIEKFANLDIINFQINNKMLLKSF